AWAPCWRRRRPRPRTRRRVTRRATRCRPRSRCRRPRRRRRPPRPPPPPRGRRRPPRPRAPPPRPRPPPRPPPPPPAPPPRPPPPTAPPVAPTEAPVTDVFAQAPQTGTTPSAGFQPFMIGDLGFSALAAAGTSTVTPRPPVSVPGKAGGLVGAIAQTGQGAFKITENESPRPVDRVFATYNFFNRVGSGLGSDIPTFDVHRETLGFEKTFLDGDASVGMRVSATQTAGDGSFTASDFNNVNVITKYALINDRASGDVWSAGLAVSVPVGPPIDLPNGGR